MATFRRLGAIVSVILSTIDSSLLAIGALAARNLFAERSEHHDSARGLLSARLFVVLAGSLSCLVALSAESIYALVLQADALGTAGIVVITVAALFTRAGGPIAAISTLVVALASSASGKYLFDYEAPFLLSLVLSIATFVLVSRIERSRTPFPGQI